jgi:plasmid stability protein
MAKSITKTNRPRLTLDIPPALRRRIKVAAATHDLSVSDYVTRILDRAVPGGRALMKKVDGTITADTVRRSTALRAEQPAPFADDSADLIREARLERNDQL